MRKFKKVFIVIFSTIVLFVAMAVVLSLVYEEKIAGYLVSEINSRMEAEVKAKKINFSLLEKFPFASVRLDSMTVTPNDRQLPKLYSAKTTFLEFNILELLAGNYTIRNIEIRKGAVHVYSSGSKNNYDIMKKSGSHGKFSLALRNVRLNDVSLTVDNNSELLLKTFFSTASFKGKFSEKEYDLTAALDGKIRELTANGVNYLKSKSIRLSSELQVQSGVYSITNCLLTLQELNFKVEGKITDNKKISTDLRITGEDIEIRDLYTLLPEKLMPRETDEYKSEGDLDFAATFTGPIDSNAVNAEFNIRKGNLVYVPEKIELKNITLEGRFTNGKKRSMESAKISLSGFYAETTAGRVSGDLILSDLSDPNLDLNLKAVTTLENILPFVKQDVVKHGKGRVDIQAHYIGPVKRARNIRDLQAIRSGGVVRLRGVALELKKDPVVIKDLDAIFTVDKNDLMITKLDLDFNGSSFNVTGRFDNLIPSLFSKDEKLQAYLDLKSDNANLEAFLPSGEDAKGSSSSLTFPFSSGSMKIDFKRASFERFQATSVKGTLTLKDDMHLEAENVSFETMGGKVNFNGSSDFMIKGIDVKGDAMLENINISSLFYVFNNFGQHTLTDQHIKGEANARINFRASWNHKHQFEPYSLYALCDLTVEKGQLINFEPVFQLSNFISLSELKDIRFSRLHNNFIVKDGKVMFPEMTVNSNALNLTCSGSHYFNNKVDYHFEIALNDLLWQKAKRSKPQNEEFGVEEEDFPGKIKLHVSMAGDIDSPVFAYDKKSFRKSLEEEAQQEKLLVKGLLKKDLGMFKADTAVKAPQAKKEKPLKVEWNENEPKQPESSKTKEKKEKGKVGKLLNKIAKPDREERSGENADDFN